MRRGPQCPLRTRREGGRRRDVGGVAGGRPGRAAGSAEGGGAGRGVLQRPLVPVAAVRHGRRRAPWMPS